MARDDTEAAGTPATPSPVAGLVAAAAQACRHYGRRDLEHRLRIAAARLQRPFSVACIVGEFKQGKSALVNGLLGDQVCPEDDDLATAAITWIYPASETAARIRRVADDGPLVEEIDPVRLPDYVSERGNPDNRLRVEIAELGLPNALLSNGLSLVDTPGSGGAAAARTAAILEFLPYADALIFTTDASAELSAPEIEFLQSARRVCPTVLVALTKIDLHPEWRRIAEIDSTYLQGAGVSAGPIPISAALRREALRRKNAELDEESGFPGLLEAIQGSVLGPARESATARALADTRAILTSLLGEAEDERRALADAGAVRHHVEELTQARSRLADLRRSTARWTTVLNDEISDLIHEVDYRLRTGIQSALTESDELFGSADPAAIWEEHTAGLRERLAELVGGLFGHIEGHTAQIAERIGALLGEDAQMPAPDIDEGQIDIDAMWSERDRPAPARGGGGPASLLAAVRGGTSGIITIGVVGGLAGLAFAGPVSIGAGIAFGSKQFLDERQRRAEQRRREARTIIQQFLGRAQMELAARTRRVIQERHRMLRDGFSEQISQLDASCAATIARLEDALDRGESERRRRTAVLEKAIADLRDLLHRVEVLGAAQHNGAEPS